MTVREIFRKYILNPMQFVKKPFDLLDDTIYLIVDLLAKSLPKDSPILKVLELIGKFAVAGVMLGVHFIEFLKSADKFADAYDKLPPGSQKRKTYLITRGLSFLLSGIGTGLAVTLIIGINNPFALGIIGTALLPVLPAILPGLLVGIYALNLYRKYDNFRRAKAESDGSPDAIEKIAIAKRKMKFAVLELTCAVLVTVGVSLATGGIALIPTILLAAGAGIATIAKIVEKCCFRKKKAIAQPQAEASVVPQLSPQSSPRPPTPSGGRQPEPANAQSPSAASPPSPVQNPGVSCLSASLPRVGDDALPNLSTAQIMQEVVANPMLVSQPQPLEYIQPLPILSPRRMFDTPIGEVKVPEREAKEPQPKVKGPALGHAIL